MIISASSIGVRSGLCGPREGEVFEIRVITPFSLWRRRRTFVGGNGVYREASSGKRPGVRIERQLDDLVWLYQNNRGSQ